VAVRAFAGRFGGAREERPRVEAALRRDGPAESAALGELTLAWTGGSGDVRAVIDGRPWTDALARQLELDPATSADQIVAAGWEVLGERMLARLDGEFALAVWDGSRGMLARDRLGARPLFVAEVQGGLVFASEVRGVLALLAARPAPDAVAVAQWLARTPARDDRTLYSGVRRLRAGHALVFGHGLRREHAPRVPRYAPPRSVEAREAAEQVRDVLGRAVERSLEGERRPAVMLSGGLDSAAVAAAAGGSRPAAYSVVFPADPAVDESARIARVRERLGLDWVEARFGGGSALAAAAEFMREWELPSVSPNLFVWIPLLRRAAADGVDVMLDGEGGDELFGCARYLVADRLRAGRPAEALRLARRLPGMGARPRARWLRRALVSYGLRGALPYGMHERLRAARGSDRPPPWLAPQAADERHDDPWAWKQLAGPRWWAQLADQLTVAGDALGAPDQLRREAALAGIELRHPLRDPELVDLVLSLPPELGFDAHLDRPLVRRALAGELPAETLREDAKPAFNSLLTAALSGPDLPTLRALLAEPHPELARRVHKEAVAALLGGSASSRAWGLDLWRLATLEMWLEHQADPGGAPPRALGSEMVTQVSFTEGVGHPRQDR
jgi:asparagine synthase (glutamine-hydrolysing)